MHQNKVKPQKKVIILGGGLAGLSAAYELAKNKISVEVYELQDDIGGLARTVVKNGFKFDTGPHRWYTKNDHVNKWMLNLLGKDVIRVPRLTRIYFDGKFFFYPIKLMNALLGIGVWKSFNAIWDYIIARFKFRFIRVKLITMEDGYINQFGKTLYEIFFKRYSEKLWGQDCRKISIDWVGQRTRGLNILTVLKDTFLKSKDVVSLVDEFSYPKNGIGIIAQKLAAGIKKNQGKIFIKSEIVEIKYHKDKIESVVVKQKEKNIKVDGDYFISSIPLNDFILRLTPKISEQIITLANKLRYRDELQVALFINKTHITPDTWIYIHPKEIPYMRVMEMDNWSNTLSPKGTTTLVFEVACNQGDHMWKKTDNEVIQIVSKSFINEFKLIKKENVLGGYVHRVPKEYPVYHINYRGDVDQIKEYLKKFINLQLIGRNGTFRYNNMDHSVEMGLFSAWNIISGNNIHNIESVNIEREYLEEKRIENPDDVSLEQNNG